jgi:Domain of unknown function (DUF4157)
MVIYTDLFVPARFDAFTYGAIILVRPKSRDDAALLAHEQVHAVQFRQRPFSHGLRMLFSRSYRQACELEAYKKQLTFPNQSVDIVAGYLASNYDLGITKEQAIKLLEE